MIWCLTVKFLCSLLLSTQKLKIFPFVWLLLSRTIYSPQMQQGLSFRMIHESVPPSLPLSLIPSLPRIYKVKASDSTRMACMLLGYKTCYFRCFTFHSHYRCVPASPSLYRQALPTACLAAQFNLNPLLSALILFLDTSFFANTKGTFLSLHSLSTWLKSLLPCLSWKMMIFPTAIKFYSVIANW